jgi:hypothetical protein
VKLAEVGIPCKPCPLCDWTGYWVVVLTRAEVWALQRLADSCRVLRFRRGPGGRFGFVIDNIAGATKLTVAVDPGVERLPIAELR